MLFVQYIFVFSYIRLTQALCTNTLLLNIFETWPMWLLQYQNRAPKIISEIAWLFMFQKVRPENIKVRCSDPGNLQIWGCKKDWSAINLIDSQKVLCMEACEILNEWRMNECVNKWIHKWINNWINKYIAIFAKYKDLLIVHNTILFLSWIF